MSRGNTRKVNGITAGLVAVIAVVLALGVYAVSEPISDSIKSNRATKLTERVQTGDATVSELADYYGMTYDEYIASYDITEEDEVTEDMSMGDFVGKLTLENYLEFAGMTYTNEDFETYKAANELGDDVTLESKDMDVKSGFGAYIYQKMQEEQAAQNAEETDATNVDATAVDATTVDETVADDTAETTAE